jgi:predicted RNase H-like nuclease
MKKFTTRVFDARNGSRYVVDRLKAADRGTVEVQSVVEDRLVERRDRNREVLHDAGKVTEADVDHLDALVLDVLQQLVAVCEHSFLHGRDEQYVGPKSVRV